MLNNITGTTSHIFICIVRLFFKISVDPLIYIIDILFLHFILFIQEKVPESEERIYPSPGNLQDEMPAAGIFEGKLA